MSVRVVLGAGSALLLALLFVTLAQSAPRPAGSNFVPEVQEAVKLRGDERHCQEGETIPGDTGALRLLVGTYGRPAPEVRVAVRSSGGRLITDGRRPAGGPEGRLEIPLSTVDETTPAARVCIDLRGSGRTVLYGAGDRVRLEWLRSGRESWLALLPTIAHRFSLGRADVLGWLLLPLAALLVLLCWIAAVRLVLREVGNS